MPVPDFLEYHKTVNAELRAIKDRLKLLINHRLTEGEFKEAALRAVLRRHLPATLRIGRGFIVTSGECSPQIDLLIVDDASPLLFQDGDLLVVTPDAVRAVIEVKTILGSANTMREALSTLAEVGNSFARHLRRPWLGLFVYESRLSDRTVLQCLSEIAQHHRAVECVTVGENRFFRFWRAGEAGNDVENRQPRFESYNLQGLAPSYFMGNVVDHVSPLQSAFAWYPLREGKNPHMTGSIVTFENDAN
jgi:hypothetical protein